MGQRMGENWEKHSRGDEEIGQMISFSRLALKIPACSRASSLNKRKT